MPVAATRHYSWKILLHRGPFSGDTSPTSRAPIAPGHTCCRQGIQLLLSSYKTHFCKMLLLQTCFVTHILSHEGQGGPSLARSFGVVPIYDTPLCLGLSFPSHQLWLSTANMGALSSAYSGNMTGIEVSGYFLILCWNHFSHLSPSLYPTTHGNPNEPSNHRYGFLLVLSSLCIGSSSMPRN